MLRIFLNVIFCRKYTDSTENGKEYLKYLMKNRIFRAGAALFTACVLALASGCSIKFGTNKKIKDSEVVAYCGDEIKITYGEFAKQYLFVLSQYGLEDDEALGENGKALRQDIIDNLVTEKILLLKAKELGVDTLSDEEKASIEESLNNQIENMKNALVAEKATSDMTDEEKAALGEEELNKELENARITKDDLKAWLENYTKASKVIDKEMEKVDRSAAEQKTADTVKEAERLYEEDFSAYESGIYASFWLPEDSRMIKHILVGFDEDTVSEITSKRKDDPQAADKLVEEAASELELKVNSLENEIKNGTAYSDLLLTYASNSAAASIYPDGYLVVPKADGYGKAFLDAAYSIENIGEYTKYTDDNGIHVLIYSSDAKITDDDLNSNTDKFLSQMKSDKYTAALNEWKEEYSPTINYELLRIDAPDGVSSESSDN